MVKSVEIFNVLERRFGPVILVMVHN